MYMLQELDYLLRIVNTFEHTVDGYIAICKELLVVISSLQLEVSGN